jgi:methylenetetrahydrofolate--tRNA-(uracil-5-)-methyltransferase
MNVNFGLFPALEGRIPKKLRGAAYAERGLEALEEWMGREDRSSVGDSNI